LPARAAARDATIAPMEWILVSLASLLAGFVDAIVEAAA
jgi:hypothetical protein